MAKIVAIDYGQKRTGIAETDDLQMMAFGLTAVETPKLLPFLEKHFQTNSIETVVVGLSLNLQGTLNEIEVETEKFITQFKKQFPTIKIERQDERFTSKMASQSLVTMGKKKKDRQNKFLVDEMSATLILQSYLQTIQA